MRRGGLYLAKMSGERPNIVAVNISQLVAQIPLHFTNGKALSYNGRFSRKAPKR
jgi:hypothetical protein